MEKTQFKMNLPNDLKTKLFVTSCMNETSISEEIIRILRSALDNIQEPDDDSESSEKIVSMIGDINSRLKSVEKTLNNRETLPDLIDKKTKENVMEIRLQGYMKKINEHTKQFDHISKRLDEIDKIIKC